jgi:hypothetical protein
VDHDVGAAQGQGQPLAVAHVAEEEAHLAVDLGVEALAQLDLHLVLLQLVTGVDDDFARVGARQHRLDEAAAERAGAAGD